MEKPPSLFISYSRKDEELAKRLVSEIGKYGIDVFDDENFIRPGGDLSKAIEEGFKIADCILVLITPQSDSSLWVKKELMFARDIVLESKGEKLLLPIIHGDVEIPYFISDIEILFLRDNYNEITERIAAIVFDFINLRKSRNGSREPYIKEKFTGKLNKESNIDNTENENDRNEKIKSGNRGNIGIKENEKSNLKGGGERNYWLLKMNPQTWEIDELNVGEITFFNTYYLGQKRPEFEKFRSVKEGDFVLGYASGDYQGIVCEMEVVKPVGPNNEQGESFLMEVKNVIKPFIPLTSFTNEISKLKNRLLENGRPPELFFLINEHIYGDILSYSFSGNFDQNFQPFYLTEGNHIETSDQLDFENDYNSFASVISLKRVNPPLAIGLFGNWGSGKSFFMEKLQLRIEELSSSNDDDYLKHIVPVKFNSWHYSDTNLWASLTTHIFESLNDYARKKKFGADAINAIYKDLNITTQQLEETERKLAANAVREKALKQQFEDKEEIIKNKKEKLDLWKGGDFVKLVFSDPLIQQDFEGIKEQFQEEKLIDNIYEIDKKYSEIETVSLRIFESFSLLKENRKGKWWIIWILAIIFSVVAWLVLGPLRELVENFIRSGIVVTAMFIGWFTNLLVQLNPYRIKILKFYNRLKSLKETVEREKKNVRLKEHDEIELLQADIARLEFEKSSIELEQTEIEKRKERLEREIEEIGSGKLLANFLEGKSADDAYIKQLGIISWIRKDFSILNDLFERQRAVQQNESGIVNQVQIDRIVLYIDDLDRCNEDVVVKVLEAIHLLLAFPLFVVVVGVDPRWLNNALSEKYKTLFGVEKQKGDDEIKSSFTADPDSNFFNKSATSYDYLEKIFQIPFALKPINKIGQEKLIKYLLKDEMADETSKLKQDQEISEVEKNIENEALPLSKQKIQKQGSLQPTIDKEKKDTEKRIRERLVFTNEELAYMQKISPLFGHSPRTINRYVNIYRIIKAHGNLKVENGFSKEEFMPIMFILGVVIGHSTFAEKFIAEVSKAPEDKSFKKFISDCSFGNTINELLDSLTFDIEALSMRNFKKNIELISRFSFRTLLK